MSDDLHPVEREDLDEEDDVSTGKDECPVCGRFYPKDTTHRCDPDELDAIDRAHSRASIDPPIQREPNDYRRLEEGFAMLDDDGEPDKESDFGGISGIRPLTRRELIEWRRRNPHRA
jgi:hypothetical protein